MNVEAVIERLLGHFGTLGCLRLPSPDQPMAAGTFAPHVFFELLVERGARLAHLQVVRRPLDARGGGGSARLSPRLQLYTLRAQPDEPPVTGVREALEAIGFDPARHDVRLLPFELELAAIGVSASGWRLLLDGLEIGHHVRIERAAGMPLAATPTEVVYHVERLAMISAGRDSREALRWGADSKVPITLRQEERELATYHVEAADPRVLRRIFDAYLEEAERCLDRGLLLVAYRQLIEATYALEIMAHRAGRRERLREQLRSLQRLFGICATEYLGRSASEVTGRSVSDGRPS